MKAFLSCLVVVASLSNRGQLAAQASCRLSVPVIALASRPTGGFAANDLRATVKGNEITIKEIKPPPATRRFVFVLDRSGSMVGVRGTQDSPVVYDLDRLMRQDVEQSLGEIPAGDSIAFLAFSGKKSSLSGFASQAAALADLPAILAWKPGKGIHKTPLWQNIETALQMLSPHEPGDVIVVVSDGRDNMSKLSKGRVQNDLLRTGVPILAVIVANPYAPATMEGADELRDFVGLADSTGGAAAVDDSALDTRFTMSAQLFLQNQLIQLLAHQYELEMETPPIQKREKWELKANSTAAGRNLNLLYPRYLLPCTETH
jgi:hypothetical protein